MCFVWISEQTAIISLYSINWLVFITQTECVCCAVRTGSLTRVKLSLQIPWWAYTVSRRPATVEVGVRSQASQYGFCCERSDTGIDFSPSISVCPVRIIAPMLHSHILFIYYRRRIILAIDTASLNKIPLLPPHTHTHTLQWELYHHEAPNIAQVKASTAGLGPAVLLVLLACRLNLLEVCACKSSEKADGWATALGNPMEMKGNIKCRFDAPTVTFVWDLHSFLSRTINVLLQDRIRPPTSSYSSSLLLVTSLCAILVPGISLK